nr:geranylgeranylglyceryl/heptaprenylglyceryl phosphate synthase [candidate division Zixibacteria bacterium]
MQVFKTLMEVKENRGGGFLLLLDPDRSSAKSLLLLAEKAAEYHVDALLVGSSFIIQTGFHDMVRQIKNRASVPVIIFPGSHSQISPYADAVLFTSLISGRNPLYLIEEQVRGAPLMKEYGLEPIPTGYMLIDSGRATSVQYVSGTYPIPADKPDIACAHALAAQYLGMKMVFMEAGSGAKESVPEEMIAAVTGYIDLPVMVGGGLRQPEEIERRIQAGASFVVVGNHFEAHDNLSALLEFTSAAHPTEQVHI